MPVYIDPKKLGVDGNSNAAAQIPDPDYKYVSIRRTSLNGEGEGGASDPQSDASLVDNGGGTGTGAFTGHAGATAARNGGDEALRTQLGNNNAYDAAPSGTGKTLAAPLLGQSGADGDAAGAAAAGLAVDAADPAAGISHATTVLAWARVDGTSASADGDDHRETIHIESFSWGVSQHGAHSAPTGGASDGRGPEVKVFEDAAGAGDDVVVDGRIITAPNDVPAALHGPFDDLSDAASGGIDAGPYYTGYVKVSDDGFD